MREEIFFLAGHLAKPKSKSARPHSPRRRAIRWAWAR